MAGSAGGAEADAPTVSGSWAACIVLMWRPSYKRFSGYASTTVTEDVNMQDARKAGDIFTTDGSKNGPAVV